MQKAYYIPSRHLYSGAPFSFLWPFSQALAATVAVSNIPHMHRRYGADLAALLQGLQNYWNYAAGQPSGYLSGVAPPLGVVADRYNDDNEWVALELLRIYHRDHSAPLLRTAEELFELITQTWNASPTAPCPGGIPFTDLARGGDRNTVSNAPGAELGAQLYLTTRRRVYLRWAKRMYSWVRTCMLKPSGLYADHIGASGKVDPTEWTYNQGTMIGAGVMLYEATREPVFLRAARRGARASYSRFRGAAIIGQPLAFNAIYLRNLLLLAAATHDSKYRSFARGYANYAWRALRDPHTNLFVDPSGASDPTTRLLDQASLVQVFGMLAAPADSYF